MSQHRTSKEPDDGPHPVNNRQPEANRSESETTQPALRAFLLGGFTLEQADGVPIDVVTSIGRSQSLLLLKLLLCHPRRQMARELLTDIIWPGQPFSTMKGSLSVAKSLLKTGLEALCGYAVLPHATGDPPSYRLIGQNVLWTDVDACEYAIRQAIATPQAREAMVLWETAYALLQRGTLLATDQEAYWYHAHLVQDRGKKLAKQRSQCVGRIADLALMCGDANRAIDVLTTEHEVHPIHEDTAFYLMDLLAQLGRNAEALQAYARLEAALLERDAEPRPEVHALAQRLRSNATTRASVHRHVLVPQEEMGEIVTESSYLKLDVTKAAKRFIQANYPIRFPLLPIPPVLNMSQESNLDLMRPHRQVLYDLLLLASTILIVSPSMTWAFQADEPLAISVTGAALDDLEGITSRYWSLCKNASIDLLGNLLEHFQTIIHLLRQPQPTEISSRLYSLAGECTQLLGKTLFDLQEYMLAWFYYAFSLKAAQAASNHELWAAGLGRMSLLLIYWKYPQKALPFLQEAHQLTIQESRIRSWLAAIEAEVYAYLGDVEACDAALTCAKAFIASEILEEDRYATGFNPSRVAGYEGACFVRLRQPDRALPALQQAVALLDPQAIRRQSTLFADLGLAYAQQGNIQQASEFAIKALAITVQTRSLSVFERVRLVYSELESSQNSEDVQRLEQQILSTFARITHEETVS